MAKLYFYYGTMFSAKSAKLVIMIHNFKEHDRNPLVLTSSIDTRFGKSGEIHSRIAGLKYQAVPVFSGESDATDIYSLYANDRSYDVIIADEVHFFNQQQIMDLERIVDDYDVNVFAFGLRSSFKGELFPATSRLMATAETIREIKTMCKCGRKATVNALISNGLVVTEGDEIHVGDSEYAAYCRRCWKKHMHD